MVDRAKGAQVKISIERTVTSNIRFQSLALSVLLLTLPCPVAAQQPTKVPRIGYFAGGTDSTNPRFLSPSGKLFEISVISRGKTFCLRTAMLREIGTASQAWWRNWFNSKSMCF